MKPKQSVWIPPSPNTLYGFPESVKKLLIRKAAVDALTGWVSSQEKSLSIHKSRCQPSSHWQEVSVTWSEDYRQHITLRFILIKTEERRERTVSVFRQWCSHDSGPSCDVNFQIFLFVSEFWRVISLWNLRLIGFLFLIVYILMHSFSPCSAFLFNGCVM